ncbi:hypothetical protein BN85403270 [Alteracholeplasma palmae J233]|uniref:Uncharacterized protein n=1 Tax=Alteracholeplasma palmae (strain ATCC 49389 / J233) TaxID=1318466 RepID=U4KJY8_ALTPJ|nr:hypothetical protein [Alteracholeplasma palmae]CCV63904.1 hypothetical protein BN85403270 [Alteracholeplasma palmae J233]
MLNKNIKRYKIACGLIILLSFLYDFFTITFLVVFNNDMTWNKNIYSWIILFNILFMIIIVISVINTIRLVVKLIQFNENPYPYFHFKRSAIVYFLIPIIILIFFFNIKIEVVESVAALLIALIFTVISIYYLIMDKRLRKVYELENLKN